MTRRGTDDGFATVWGAVAVVALLAVAGGLWLFGHVATVRHQVANAADLAALAAAGRIDHGVDRPCETAETVTDRMRVRLADCRVCGPDALVIVESDGAPLLAPFGPVTARARADLLAISHSPATLSQPHQSTQPDSQFCQSGKRRVIAHSSLSNMRACALGQASVQD